MTPCMPGAPCRRVPWDFCRNAAPPKRSSKRWPSSPAAADILIRCLPKSSRSRIRRRREVAGRTVIGAGIRGVRPAGARATVQRIAADLSLSASTIGTHLYNIKQKLGVANQSELTLIAIRHGLIEADDSNPRWQIHDRRLHRNSSADRTGPRRVAALWRGYQSFYKTTLLPRCPRSPGRACSIRRSRWARRSPGTQRRRWDCVHHIRHRSCWTTGDYIYLQDLFVSPEARGHRHRPES